MSKMNGCWGGCEDDTDTMDANLEMMKNGKYRRRDTMFAINTEVGGEYKK